MAPTKEEAVALFTKCGLNDKTAAETLKNPALTETLFSVFRQVW